MHYANLVIVEDDQYAELSDLVKDAMWPDEEHGGFWDWYEVGGRWSGALKGANHIPVSELTQEILDGFYRVVLPHGYGVFAREKWLPWDHENPFLKLPMPTLEWIKKNFPKEIAIVVDSHS